MTFATTLGGRCYWWSMLFRHNLASRLLCGLGFCAALFSSVVGPGNYSTLAKAKYNGSRDHTARQSTFRLFLYHWLEDRGPANSPGDTRSMPPQTGLGMFPGFPEN
ncbi:hypothetical protein BJX66DRAFT_260197 [Aspergillus keveii]|uniref:Secreted protein n=1 Tax=Aspergillus keveii TaxID=714993 RepID=A0ABR4GK14_9EURO